MRRGISSAVALVIAGALCGGCADTGTYNGAENKVCGQVVGYNSSVTDVRGRLNATIQNLAVGGVVILQVADCSVGADVTVTPSSAATQVQVAKSSDGKIAAVSLRPTSTKPFVVSASHGDEIVARATIDLVTNSSS